ncbi:MAG: NUDIX domain-containing protein [Caldilineaceae bacterium]
MQASDQGTRHGGKHLAVPRTLIFLTSTNPATGADEVLLLQGATTKRLWAGKFNGIGGHVEADEDVHAAAVREVARGDRRLDVDALTLAASSTSTPLHDEQGPRPGVMMFVFTGNAPAFGARHPRCAGVDSHGKNRRPSLVDDLYACRRRWRPARSSTATTPDDQGRMHITSPEPGHKLR